MSKKLNLKFDFKDAYTKMFARITASILNAILSVLLSLLLFANDVIKQETPFFWPILATLVALFLVSIGSVFNEHKKQDAYIYSEYLQKDIENKELEQDRKDLIGIIFETREFMGFVYNFLVFSKMIRTEEVFKSGDIEGAKKLLGIYLKDFLFDKLRTIFGKNKDEHFSLAIYLYDQTEDVLWDFLSKKDPKINKNEDAGRDWHREDYSHIAFCFNHRSELIHSNIPKRFKDFGLDISSSYNNATDLDNYKSAVTLPIYFRKPGNPETKVIVGVFCLTSDNIGTFHEPETTVTDPVYSLKILLLRILVELIANNLSLLYENDETKIKKLHIRS